MGETKPDINKPGDFHDRRGIPIYPGDLLKSKHFYCRAERRWYYHYHVATFEDTWGHGRRMMMTPTQWLDPSDKRCGGRCAISQDLMDNAEVISGHGPGATLSHYDRPRVRVAKRSESNV